MSKKKIPNGFNYKLYKTISCLSQENLHKSLERFLVNNYSEDRVVELEGSFVCAIGDTPICLVAHLDTVHKTAPNEMYYDREENVIWSPNGLGADDRAGVYAIMTLIKRGLRPTVLFTWDEEIGGVGAQNAATVLNLEDTVDFCIELDRRGKNDSVYYDCDNPDFEEYINGFGFETAIGSFSDICFLCPEWKVAGVNLSIGYVNEHTAKEMLHVDWMMNTIDRVEQICLSDAYDKEKFKYIESPTSYSVSSWGGVNYWNGWESYFDRPLNNKKENQLACAYDESEPIMDSYRYNKNNEDICYSCGGIFPGYKTVPIDDEVYCYDCYDRVYSYCSTCHTLYKREGGNCLCNN